MKRIFAVFLLAFFLTVPEIFVAQEKPVCAHKKGKCCSATRFSNCPAAGCGGDAELNRKKNTLEIPKAQDIKNWTLSDIVALTFPAVWKSGTKRTLLETWGEGTPVRVKAFLIHAKNYSSGIESCNCNLRKDENNDWHLVLVEKDFFGEKSSVTAEISPRIRRPGWTFKQLKDMSEEKTYVRVTGWIMLDTQHIKKPLKRLTNWEIHPVTNFEVCTSTVVACDQGQGWRKLEDVN